MGERKMNLEKLAKITSIGDLAIQLHKAEAEVKRAKREYQERLWQEGSDYKPDPRAEEGEPGWNEVQATKAEFEALSKAKKHAYNIKRRLGTACRNF